MSDQNSNNKSNEPHTRVSSHSTAVPVVSTTQPNSQNLLLGLILGGAILVLLYLVFTSRGGSFTEAGRLKKERDQLYGELNVKRRELGQPLLATDGQSAEPLINRINTDSDQLQALITKIQSDLTANQTEASSLRNIVNSNSSTMANLQQQNSQLSTTASQAQSLAQQLKAQQTLLASSQQRVLALEQQLATAPDPTAIDALRARLTATSKERDSYEEQLRLLKSETSTMVTAGDLNGVSRENNQLTAENKKLRYELQQIRAQLDKNLFVDADKLSPIAQKLFSELSSLEGVSNEDRLKRYVKLNSELKASVIDSVKFGTGTSDVAIQKVDAIRRTLQNSRPDSFFLVVGYASQTGDYKTNRSLSSQRATTVASQVNYLKQSSQGIQATFLGQTNRFSNTSPVENQLCEIWEIRK